MAREKIICTTCSAQHELVESVVCGCGTRIYTTLELKAKIKEIDTQIIALRCEATGLERELFNRERARTMTDIKGKPISTYENFWTHVYGAPRDVKPAAKPKRAEKSLSEAELAEFV